MQQSIGNVLTRDDTFFGICEALGEDFRFNAQYLRIALAIAFFFSPVATIGGYAALGIVVAVSRIVAPNPRIEAPAEALLVEIPATEPAETEHAEEALPIAA